MYFKELIPIFLSTSFCFQPPPKFTDKQLEEREHTVDEWKGETARLNNTPLASLALPFQGPGTARRSPAPYWSS